MIHCKLNQLLESKVKEDHTPWIAVTGGYAKDMDLRDYFAAKALQGLLASDVNANMYEFARRAYKMADIMLEVRDAAQ